MTQHSFAETCNLLADRCEGATGPDRELDVTILTTVMGYRDVHGDGRMFDRGNDGYWWVDDCSIQQLPSPTASLDAAMTLIPESFDWMLGRTNDGLTIHAEVGGRGDQFMRFGETPALALCAAALRARAQVQS